MRYRLITSAWDMDEEERSSMWWDANEMRGFAVNEVQRRRRLISQDPSPGSSESNGYESSESTESRSKLSALPPVEVAQ